MSSYLSAIALPNGVEFYQASIAAWKLGATPQPVSAKLPFLERDEIIELAEPSLIVGVEPGTHGDRPAVPIGWQPSASLSDEPLPVVIAKHYKAMTSGGSTGRLQQQGRATGRAPGRRAGGGILGR